MTVTTEVETLLLTDIEGSTALWERNPDVMGGAVARHEVLVQSAVADAGGKVLKQKGEGDSTFSVFADPAAAVNAAVRLGEAMASEPWPTDEPLRVRAGVHTGVVEWRDGDCFGRAVNAGRGMGCGG